MAGHSPHLLALARRGAELRLRELASEATHLLAVFPHLRDSFDADELPIDFIIAEGARSARGATAARRRASRSTRRGASDRVRNSWPIRRRGEQK